MRRRRYATVAIVFITQREWLVTYLASYEVNIYLWLENIWQVVYKNPARVANYMSSSCSVKKNVSVPIQISCNLFGY